MCDYSLASRDANDPYIAFTQACPDFSAALCPFSRMEDGSSRCDVAGLLGCMEADEGESEETASASEVTLPAPPSPGSESLVSGSSRQAKTTYRGQQEPCNQCLQVSFQMAPNSPYCTVCNNFRMGCYRDAMKSDAGRQVWEKACKDPAELRKMLGKWVKVQKARSKDSKKYVAFDFVDQYNSYFAVKRMVRGTKREFCGEKAYCEVLMQTRGMTREQAVDQWEKHSSDPDAYNQEHDFKYGAIRLLIDVQDYVTAEEEKGQKQAVVGACKRKKNVTDAELAELQEAVGSGFASGRTSFYAGFASKVDDDDVRGLTRKDATQAREAVDGTSFWENQSPGQSKSLGQARCEGERNDETEGGKKRARFNSTKQCGAAVTELTTFLEKLRESVTAALAKKALADAVLARVEGSGMKVFQHACSLVAVHHEALRLAASAEDDTAKEFFDYLAGLPETQRAVVSFRTTDEFMCFSKLELSIVGVISASTTDELKLMKTGFKTKCGHFVALHEALSKSVNDLAAMENKKTKDDLKNVEMAARGKRKKAEDDAKMQSRRAQFAVLAEVTSKNVDGAAAACKALAATKPTSSAVLSPVSQSWASEMQVHTPGSADALDYDMPFVMPKCTEFSKVIVSNAMLRGILKAAKDEFPKTPQWKRGHGARPLRELGLAAKVRSEFVDLLPGVQQWPKKCETLGSVSVCLWGPACPRVAAETSGACNVRLTYEGERMMVAVAVRDLVGALQRVPETMQELQDMLLRMQHEDLARLRTRNVEFFFAHVMPNSLTYVPAGYLVIESVLNKCTCVGFRTAVLAPVRPAVFEQALVFRRLCDVKGIDAEIDAVIAAHESVKPVRVESGGSKTPLASAIAPGTQTPCPPLSGSSPAEDVVNEACREEQDSNVELAELDDIAEGNGSATHAAEDDDLVPPGVADDSAALRAVEPELDCSAALRAVVAVKAAAGRKRKQGK